jgi:two-component system LytT family response regulator
MDEISIFIVDDQMDTYNMVSSFASLIPGIHMLGFQTDPKKACQQLLSKEIEPDILLLDVEMPEMDGVELGTALQMELEFPIIYVTGHTKYGYQAFEIDAVDYILKPISLPRFLLALIKAKRRIAQNRGLAGVYIDQLFVPGNGKSNHYPISADSIRYIKSDSAYSYIYTTKKDKDYHYTHYSLKELEQALDVAKFVRASRSYIVNISMIARVSSKHIELDNGLEISIGDNYKEEVKRRLRLR